MTTISNIYKARAERWPDLMSALMSSSEHLIGHALVTCSADGLVNWGGHFPESKAACLEIARFLSTLAHDAKEYGVKYGVSE